MSNPFGVSGISSSGGINHIRERDLNETAGTVAHNDQSAFGKDIDISKAQLPEGCRELGWG